MSSKIRGHCLVCHYSFFLAELIRAPFFEGHCPSCGCPLAEDRPALRRLMGRAVYLHETLVDCVRALVALPGNFELLPHSLLRDFLDGIDWEDEIGRDRELVQLQVEQLRRYLRTWMDLAGAAEARERSEIRAGLGRLAGLLRRLAGRVGAEDRPEAMRSAADRIEALAAAMEDTRPGDAEVRGALEAASRSARQPEARTAP